MAELTTVRKEVNEMRAIGSDLRDARAELVLARVERDVAHVEVARRGRRRRQARGGARTARRRVEAPSAPREDEQRERERAPH